ncbi:fatty acid-binding protein, liver-like [Esox lucius]|uniref:Cytosolic fatty-acid binding proteins domain-containing protein n=1 Tax=Esox lucius TaxID=8010 RepID=A0A3P8ZP48_ESOLU|nr:fatty acid-binding protein, liver-like [Esox lucius]
MAFNGKWKIHSQENHEEFLKAMAVPEIFIKMIKGIKPTTTIEQTGDDFTILVETPLRTVKNSFTIGKEAEITAMDGRKFTCTARLEDRKLICATDKFTHVRELQGEDMIENITAASTTLTRISKRV